MSEKSPKEKDISILELMQIMMDQFSSGKLYISDLIYDLESLINQLETVDEDWRIEFRTPWSDIEVSYAMALDEGLDQLDQVGEKIVSESIRALQKLVSAKLLELRS